MKFSIFLKAVAILLIGKAAAGNVLRDAMEVNFMLSTPQESMDGHCCSYSRIKNKKYIAYIEKEQKEQKVYHTGILAHVNQSCIDSGLKYIVCFKCYNRVYLSKYLCMENLSTPKQLIEYVDEGLSLEYNTKINVLPSNLAPDKLLCVTSGKDNFLLGCIARRVYLYKLQKNGDNFELSRKKNILKTKLVPNNCQIHIKHISYVPIPIAVTKVNNETQENVQDESVKFKFEVLPASPETESTDERIKIPLLTKSIKDDIETMLSQNNGSNKNTKDDRIILKVKDPKNKEDITDATKTEIAKIISEIKENYNNKNNKEEPEKIPTWFTNLIISITVAVIVTVLVIITKAKRRVDETPAI